MGVLFPGSFAILVLRTGNKINNPFYHAKQKSNNPVQNSPAMKPVEMARTFSMSFFGMRDLSLEIGFGSLFSGHIINRLFSSGRKKQKEKQKEMFES